MDFYQYKAIDQFGRVQVGQSDAVNVADLEMRLRKLGLDLVNCTEIRTRGKTASGRGIKRRDLILFCFHMEQTSRAGVPILDSLQDLRDSTENPRLREVMSAMTESISGGKTLSQAMQDFPGVFENVLCSLIRAGEQSGNIGEVFRRLGESLKWQDEQAAQAKKLIMYPAFVGTVVIGVLFFLMIYLVPQLVSFVKTMGQELPGHTKALIFVSGIFVHYWYAVILGPAVIVALVMIGARVNPGIRLAVDRMKLRLPVFGNILQKIILARLAGFFAMMYASGITIIDCIRTSEDIAGNKVIENAVRAVGQQIADGKNLSDSFASTGLFPPLILRMIRVGESTGALETSLENVAYFYTRDVKEAIERLQSMIEPTMTVILGVIIGWVMMSVLGPIYDLITKIKI
ncbi:MAG: type II secretion system F family protein [Gammaproteobacteria bacterium]|nr:type II secretion system F family protein [Gammaproteobacteria bacterium]